MTDTSNVKAISELVDRLNEYRDAYYNHDTSLITDQEYDYLFDRLKSLEEKYKIVLSNSPTQTVGYTTVDGLKKVQHNHPLLSLDKTTDLSQFLNFFGDKKFVLMGKLDGLTVSIKYDKGKFVSAETRGDGEIGEDISHNARMFKNLPMTIPYDGELIVDGECIIHENEIAEINKRENANYKQLRNLVSGTVRQLNSEICANRNVYFIAWKLYTNPKGEYYHYLFTQPNPKILPRESFDLNSHCDRLSFLSDLGFDTVIRKQLTLNRSDDALNRLEYEISRMKEIYGIRHIPIDGMVGMFDDLEYCESLGATAHHPKHSMAFKFYQDDNQTVLQDIEWSTSRSGLVNPVAIFDPVEIDGATVSRATLNNVSVIEDLQLGIGDTITVIKANQIIPMITQNLTRSNTYKIPDTCPSCSSKLVIKNDNGRKTLVCENSECFARLLDKFNNFVSRQGMNINGLSESRLSTLIRMGYIKTFADLYSLSVKPDLNKLVKENGFGEKILQNILQSIEESRNCKLANVIVAIGIPNIGKSAAKIIAEKCEEDYQSCKDVYDNEFECFLDSCICAEGWHLLPTIGIKTQHAINEYVEENISELLWLKKELNIISDYKPKDNSREKNLFKDKTFCITGKLEHFKNRADLVSHIESCGGKVTSSVTAKTTYLINNDKESNSSKNKSAKKFGTEIISEYDYIKMFMDNSD